LIAARAQLADLRRQIDNEIARILIGVRNDYQVATGREASLEAQLARLMEQSATMSQADVRLRELEREAHATRTLFEQYLNRVKETNEQQSLQIADARIVSPALRPNQAGSSSHAVVAWRSRGFRLHSCYWACVDVGADTAGVPQLE